MQREKARAAPRRPDPADVVEEGLLRVVVVVVVGPSCATWLPDDPPHADSIRDRPSSPAIAEARSSGCDERWLRRADGSRVPRRLSGRFTLACSLPPGKSRTDPR
jgi:hypothetical protein